MLEGERVDKQKVSKTSGLYSCMSVCICVCMYMSVYVCVCVIVCLCECVYVSMDECMNSALDERLYNVAYVHMHSCVPLNTRHAASTEFLRLLQWVNFSTTEAAMLSMDWSLSNQNCVKDGIKIIKASRDEGALNYILRLL